MDDRPVIPEAAAYWVISVCCPGIPIYPMTVQALTDPPGLMRLRVDQMNLVGSSLRRIKTGLMALKGYKDDKARQLASYFYNQQQGVDGDLLEYLQTHTPRVRLPADTPHPPTPKDAWNRLMSSHKNREREQKQRMFQPQMAHQLLLQQQMAQQLQQQLRVMAQQQPRLHAAQQPRPTQPTGKPTSTVAPSPLAKRIKTDPGPPAAASRTTPPSSSSSTSPRSPQEFSLVAELTQMGFTEDEITACLRGHFHNQTPSVDQVMLLLVTAREEAAEARKMDQARLASEQTRQEEKARRRKEQQENLQKAQEACPVADLTQVHFRHSWILQHATLPQVDQNKALKQKLLKLLRLEQKARQWYGDDLPRAYFVVTVCGQMNLNPLASVLDDQTAQLEHAMYTLSAQTGGVPKLLVLAHEQHGQKTVDDDEVEIIEVTEKSVACTAPTDIVDLS